MTRITTFSLLAALARIAFFTPQSAGNAMQFADDSCRNHKKIDCRIDFSSIVPTVFTGFYGILRDFAGLGELDSSRKNLVNCYQDSWDSFSISSDRILRII